MGGPEGGGLGFDDCGAGGGVPGYEVGEAREAGGELGFVAGAGVRHGLACLLFLSFVSFSFWGRFAVFYGKAGGSSVLVDVLSGGKMGRGGYHTKNRGLFCLAVVYVG